MLKKISFLFIIILLVTAILSASTESFIFKYKFRDGSTLKYLLKQQTKHENTEMNFEFMIPFKIVRIDQDNYADIDINVDSIKINGQNTDQNISASIRISPTGEIIDSSSSWPGMSFDQIFQFFPKEPIKMKQKWTRNITTRMYEKDLRFAIRTNFNGFKTHLNKKVAVFISTIVSEEIPMQFGKMKIIGKRIVYFDNNEGQIIEVKARAQMVIYTPIKIEAGQVKEYKKNFGPMIRSSFTLK